MHDNGVFSLAIALFESLAGSPIRDAGEIKAELNAPSLVGTVQDDPFDEWTYNTLNQSGVSERIYRAGKLKSPDITLVNDSTNDLLGLEVKKLEADHSGKDPRGLTLDYNSTVPCGITSVRYRNQVKNIPLYYYFALLQGDKIITTVVCDGNFLNSDLDFHTESKVSNISTYQHGSYGEASIRHRKMYLFPNPLNTNNQVFSHKHCLIISAEHEEEVNKFSEENGYVTKSCSRTSVNGNVDQYLIIYIGSPIFGSEANFSDVFSGCRERESRTRSPYVVEIPDS